MVLAFVVGPSGAGKDTLMRIARETLADDPRFVFVRRVVTRRPDTAAEDHEWMDEARFSSALARGEFALHWRAHGLHYGLPASIDEQLRAYRVVVANGSRAAIAVARAKYPDCAILLVTATREVRAARLAARGRESRAEVEARLAREGPELSHDIRPMVIDNSGPLEVSGAAFVKSLRQLAIEPE